MRGMELMDAQAVFVRDSKRLDARSKAVYEKLGLKIKESPGELQMVADNIQLDDAARSEIFKRLDDKEMGDVRIVADNITFLPSGARPTGGTSSTPPTVEYPINPKPSEPPVQAPSASWAKPALVAVLSALLGAGSVAPLVYYSAGGKTPAADTDTDRNTLGVLELVPDSGQSVGGPGGTP